MAMEPEQISEFCLRFNLPLEAADFLEGLPGEVRTKVLCSFDPKGSKDGNVFPRLEAFANSILNPGGGRGGGRGWGSGAGGGAWPEQAPAPIQLAVPRHPAPVVSSSMPDYCASIGLDGESASLLQLLPADMQETIMADFDPQGTKDGNVFGRLIGFARSIWAHRVGLDRDTGREAAALLRELPESIQVKVMAQFDPMRSGNGPVLARVERYAMDLLQRAGVGGAGRPVGAAPRPVGDAKWATQAAPWAPPAAGGAWQQTAQPQQPQWKSRAGTGAVSLDEFAQLIGLDAEAYAFLRALPEDVQAPIFSGFDPSGTKDGNVWGRLFGFVRSVWSHKLCLDTSMVGFLKSLPEDVQRVVMTKFDPSLSKDGNIAARLEGFARSVAARGAHGRGDAGGKGGPVRARGDERGDAGGKGGPVPVFQAPWQRQQQAARRADGPQQAPSPCPQGLTGSSSPLQAFVDRWNLNREGAQFMEALPEEVVAAVCQSFNASGTKDGNVWGRLFGFVRSVWQRQLTIPGEAFSFLRSLSEDSQRVAMMRFDPSTVSASGALAELQSINERYMAEVGDGGNVGGSSGAVPGQVPFRAAPWREGGAGGWQKEQQQQQPDAAWGAAPAGHSTEPQAVLEFAQRFGLDEQGLAFLQGLDPEVLETVVADFSAGGTKDGNVFGRLQGFANSVTARKRRRGGGFGGFDDGGYGRNVRARGGW